MLLVIRNCNYYVYLAYRLFQIIYFWKKRSLEISIFSEIFTLFNRRYTCEYQNSLYISFYAFYMLGLYAFYVEKTQISC